MSTQFREIFQIIILIIIEVLKSTYNIILKIV